MFETELAVNRFLLGYADLVTADVPDEQFADQPIAGMNHPAWVLGHLIMVGDSLGRMLGGDKHLPDGWTERFGPGSVLTSVRSDYPPKDELRRLLLETYQRTGELAANATDELVSRKNPHPRLRASLPTIRESCAFILTGHFGLHLGQLSAWRRTIGIAPLF